MIFTSDIKLWQLTVVLKILKSTSRPDELTASGDAKLKLMVNVSTIFAKALAL